MDWEQLRYVLAVERTGTLSAAAEALGVTRTTVSRRLKQAESRLGVRLFERTPEGLVATAAGSDLAEMAVRVEEEVLATEGRLRGRDAELRGHLCVSTLGFVFDGFADVFQSFTERYPQIELTVLAGSDQVSLMRGEADVALRLSNTPTEHLVGRRVGRMQFEAYISKALVDELGQGRRLGAYPWLQWHRQLDEGRWFEQWLELHAPGARVALRSNDFGVLRRAVSAGMGALFLPCFDGDADPGLVRLGARLSEEARDLWLLTLSDLRHNAKIGAFMDHAFEAFKGKRHALEGTQGRKHGR